MLSIIIPAHNEEKRISKTLGEYGKFFNEKLKNKEISDFEIVVVLNGCKDNTLGVVKNARKKYEKIRYLEFKKSGKGFAIIKGFREALQRKSDLIGFVDADMATSPPAFYDLVKNIKAAKENGGVIASRWLKNSVVTKRTFLRKITSKGFNFLVRSILLLNISDTQCGAKLFKREALEKIINEIGITEWAFDVDLLYRLKNKGFKIKEIPTVWEDKRESKLSLTRVPLRMFSAVVRLRFLHSPFGFIVRAYDKLPEKIKLHHRI